MLSGGALLRPPAALPSLQSPLAERAVEGLWGTKGTWMEATSLLQLPHSKAAPRNGPDASEQDACQTNATADILSTFFKMAGPGRLLRRPRTRGTEPPGASLRGAAEQGPSALGMRPSRPSLELAPSRKCRPSTAWRWLPPSCPAGRAGRGRRGPHARGVRPHRRRLDAGLGPAEGTEVTVGDVGGFRSCQMRSHPPPRFLCCNQAGAGVLGGGGGAPSPDP